LLGKVIALARAGDALKLIDARGKKRRLTVITKTAGAIVASCVDTVYFEDGGRIELHRADRLIAKAAISGLPYVEDPILLKVGERLMLTRLAEPGRPAQHDAHGKLTRPAAISCTLPEVFDSAKSGERIYFDDGKIGGRILSNSDGEIIVRITQAAVAGSRLGSEKGINLPDTPLNTPALTAKDLADLKFMARRADIIGMSFVRTVADIEQLWKHMDELGAANVGAVLKIENKDAFENLPRLLLSALTHPPAGVMVARGDLAIELGFERLAEVQEQILWLCEAAHVPVIWATQVLDTMARSGTPSRAEVTDAVMSGRAECVMLNKGPYMADVVRLLTDILKRMSAHQSKKRSLLRPLSISRID
jgi:pyruvate kinase